MCIEVNRITKAGNHLIIYDHIKDMSTVSATIELKDTFYVRVFNLLTIKEEKNFQMVYKLSAQAEQKFYEYIKCFSQLANNRQSLDYKERCVLCGNLMNVRTGKFGVFYSCSEWPKCKCVVNKDGKLTKETFILLQNIKLNINNKEDSNKEDLFLKDRLNNLQLD
jgi:hypothetical protein